MTIIALMISCTVQKRKNFINWIRMEKKNNKRLLYYLTDESYNPQHIT